MGPRAVTFVVLPTSTDRSTNTSISQSEHNVTKRILISAVNPGRFIFSMYLKPIFHHSRMGPVLGMTPTRAFPIAYNNMLVSKSLASPTRAFNAHRDPHRGQVEYTSPRAILRWLCERERHFWENRALVNCNQSVNGHFFKFIARVEDSLKYTSPTTIHVFLKTIPVKHSDVKCPENTHI